MRTSTTDAVTALDSVLITTSRANHTRRWLFKLTISITRFEETVN